jgi:hypothetical protein
LLAEVRADLTAHVGGAPSATQRRMVEVAARLALFVAKLDAKAAAGGAPIQAAAPNIAAEALP